MARTGRLRRSDCAGPGFTRRRRGRGFSFVDADGSPLDDPETLSRIDELRIPPAWKDVWICSDPLGHLQATGIDGAGRKQYLYHERWRIHRDREKFERMIRFARALPRLRRRMLADLADDPDPTREVVLALAARLLDVGLFRIGGEQYAEEDGGLGLATIRREHVRVSGEEIAFDYPAKSGVQRVQVIRDRLCAELIARLRRRRGGPEELMAFREDRSWQHLRSGDINEYLKRHLGEEFSAKDFRTWNGTVLAAVSLGSRPLRPGSSRQRAIRQAVRDVSELLGNTPAVARRSYIDPRVIDRFMAGSTIAGTLERVSGRRLAPETSRRQIERAVLRLID